MAHGAQPALSLSTLTRGYSRRNPKCLRIVLALFFMVGALAIFANLYLEVRAGWGGELRRSMWGYKVSPIGILVGAGATLAVYPAYSVIEWLLHHRDRALGRKHRRKRT